MRTKSKIKRNSEIQATDSQVCHQRCVCFCRDDLLRSFSYDDNIFHTVIPRFNNSELDQLIVKFIRKHNYCVAEIQPSFRNQFISFIHTHQTYIRTHQIRPSRRGPLVEKLKRQTAKICLLNQPYQSVDHFFVNECATLRSELVSSRLIWEEERQHFQSVIDEQDLVIQQLRKDCASVKKLTRQLVKQKERIRELRRAYAGSRPVRSTSTVRRLKYDAASQLKIFASQKGIKLHSATFATQKFDDPVTFDFNKNYTMKPVDAELGAKIVELSHMSMKTYRKIYEQIPDIIPCPNQVNKARHDLCKDVPIAEYVTQSGKFSECSYPELLRVKLAGLLASKILPRQPATLRIKISGDGTRVARNVSLVTLCFVVLIPESPCQAATDVCNVVLASCKEDYSSLKDIIAPALNQMEATTRIVVEELEFQLEYYFCADYKFALNALGMKSAKSNYPCIICLKHQAEFSSFVSAEARSIKNLGTAAQGVKAEPIVSFIPLDRFIPDVLHLKTRIGDQHFKFLVDDLSHMDAQITLMNKKKGRRKKGDSEQEDSPNLRNFEKYLLSIGIYWTYTIDSKTNQPVCSLSGEAYDRLMGKLDLDQACPNMEARKVSAFKASLLHFKNVLLILRLLKPTDNDITMLTDHIQEWHRNFQMLKFKQNFTPYMHLLMHHVVPILKKHGSLFPFCNEGVEQFNCRATRIYHNQTNKKSGSLTQILKSAIRYMSLSVKYGTALTNPLFHYRVQICSLCKSIGHNKRACPVN